MHCYRYKKKEIFSFYAGAKYNTDLNFTRKLQFYHTNNHKTL